MKDIISIDQLFWGNENFVQEWRERTSETYIMKPWRESLKVRNKLKIIAIPTGFGKTYNIWRRICKEWFEKFGGRVHIMIAPHKETITRGEIEPLIFSAGISNTPRVFYNGDDLNWNLIFKILEMGGNVTIVVTDSRLDSLIGTPTKAELKNPKEQKRWNKIKDSVKKQESQFKKLIGNYNTLVTRDEASYGTVSESIFYELVRGNPNPAYKGKYFRNIEKLQKWGSNTYGFTATPTREQTMEVNDSPDNPFIIIGKYPTKIESLLTQKWISLLKTPFESCELKDDDIITTELRRASFMCKYREDKIQDVVLNTPVIDNEKITAIIALQIEGKNKKDTRRVTKTRIYNILKTNHNLIQKDHTVVFTDAFGWEELNHKCEVVSKGKGDGFLDKMNDNSSKARILIVVNKAAYGVNIPSLCFGVCFKVKRTGKKYGYITTYGEQLIGRMVRANYLGSNYETLKKVHTLYNIDKNLAYQYLLLKNTFEFFAVSDSTIRGAKDYWENTFDRVRENINTTDDAMSILFPAV